MFIRRGIVKILSYIYSSFFHKCSFHTSAMLLQAVNLFLLPRSFLLLCKISTVHI